MRELYSFYRLALNLARLAWYWPAKHGLNEYGLEAGKQCMFARLEIHAALRDLDLGWVSALPIWGRK